MEWSPSKRDFNFSRTIPVTILLLWGNLINNNYCWTKINFISMFLMFKFICYRCSEWCELHDMRRGDCHGPCGPYYSAAGTNDKVSIWTTFPNVMTINLWKQSSVSNPYCLDSSSYLIKLAQRYKNNLLLLLKNEYVNDLRLGFKCIISKKVKYVQYP